MRSLLNALCTLCLVFELSAQLPLMECGSERCSAPAVKLLCMQALPREGVVQLGTGKEACTCDCPDLRGIAPETYWALRMQRDSIESAHAQAFVRSAPRYVYPGNTTRTPVPIGPFWERYYWQEAPVCPAMDVIKGIATRIAERFERPTLVASIAFVFVPEGAVVLEADGSVPSRSEMIFPWVDNTQTTPDGTRIVAVIHIPEAFVRDASVGPELVTFMLLHELHHIIHFPTSTEYEADRWAISAGLFRYNGGLKPTKVYVDAVVKQLEAYYFSQINEEDYALATASSRSGLNCYPELSCRTDHIRNPFALGLDPGSSTIQGYPERCWDERVTDEHRAREPEPLRYTGLNACVDLTPGPHYVKLELEREVQRVEEAIEHLKRDYALSCELRPDLPCSLQGAEIDEFVRTRVPDFERRERRMLRSLKKLDRQLQALKRPVVETPPGKP